VLEWEEGVGLEWKHNAKRSDSGQGWVLSKNQICGGVKRKVPGEEEALHCVS
jgi:hypothetical protein